MRDRSLAEYAGDPLLQSAVERQLMIIGEALRCADKLEPDLSDRISDIRRIVNLRNVIVHGYSTIENETIWGILQGHLPRLYEEVRALSEA